MPLGQLFTSFILVIGPKKRMIMQFSHAQYDRFCVPQIFGALQTANFNPPFSSFVHHRLHSIVRLLAKCAMGFKDYAGAAL